MPHTQVITRFAPSPTGFLHIGGVRTALFSYYFAKRHGGQFRLRIEDTDKKRSTPEATQAILDGMDWIGLKHDAEVVYQSENAQQHVAAARQLLQTGKAYRCYMSAEEQAEERQKSRDEGRAFRSPYRETSETKDAPYVVRFKVPDGQTTINDAVMGEITWNNSDFDDLILLRADGTPVYMLAVVVDDHNMGVTHVIRGDDHLTNAGRQSQIFSALGWDVPVFAHVPLIYGPDGKKLSKRHGALGVEAYADMGYLPAGLRNYLARLGWAHGDMEIFTDAQITDVFSLDGINKAPARIDFEKMAFVNGAHIAKADTDTLLRYGASFIAAKNDGPLSTAQESRVLRALPAVKSRAKTLTELAEQAEFAMLKRPLSITGKTKKSLKPDTEIRLKDLHSLLGGLKDTDWNAQTISKQLDAYLNEQDIGFGKIGPPLRASLTAGSPSPDLALVLEILGKDETIGRIQDVLDTFYTE